MLICTSADSIFLAGTMKITKAACRTLVIAYILIAAVVDAKELTRNQFPPGFVFGAAGAAYQIEGAAQEGGRAPSIWDKFSKIPGKIADGSNGDVAVDEYHRYKEDVQLIKTTGLDAYRFSISWSRVLPNGTLKGGINKVGVAYYNNLINELLKNGIKPYVTIFHWDTPQALEDKYGGFLSKKIVNDFAAFAELCFQKFGDRVKHWMTLNEPHTYSSVGYDKGTFAPGRCSKYIGNCTAGNSATEPYIVTHNLLLAHAAAVRKYRRKYQAVQNGTIGIVLNSNWNLPYTNTSTDRRAARRDLDFLLGWFLEPLTSGDYPLTMRSLVGARLPRFSAKQSLILKGSYDFIGLNHYTSRYAAHIPNPPDEQKTDYSQDSRVNITTERNGIPIGKQAGSKWLYVYPPGIKHLITYTTQRYNNPPIYITENGVDEFNDDKLPLKEALNDTWRVDYYATYLDNVRQAIRKGSDVRGYFAWSFLDNFEWADGYTVRFGLYYVDYKNNLKRYPKSSVHWFKKLLRS